MECTSVGLFHPAVCENPTPHVIVLAARGLNLIRPFWQGVAQCCSPPPSSAYLMAGRCRGRCHSTCTLSLTLPVLTPTGVINLPIIYSFVAILIHPPLSKTNFAAALFLNINTHTNTTFRYIDGVNTFLSKTSGRLVQ